jgi:hypothetical protein
MDMLNDMGPINYNTYPVDQIYTFLSHTVVPNWNVEQVLTQTISQQSAHALIREYTLLAPALMSIIVRDTFVKNYQAFIKKTPLLLNGPPSNTVSLQTTKLPFSSRKGIENLSYKELKLIWDLLQSGLQRKDQIGPESSEDEVIQEEQAQKLLLGARTWVWMKQNVCNVVNSYISMYANGVSPSS